MLAMIESYRTFTWPPDNVITQTHFSFDIVRCRWILNDSVDRYSKLTRYKLTVWNFGLFRTQNVNFVIIVHKTIRSRIYDRWLHCITFGATLTTVKPYTIPLWHLLTAAMTPSVTLAMTLTITITITLMFSHLTLSPANHSNSFPDRTGSSLTRWGDEARDDTEHLTIPDWLDLTSATSLKFRQPSTSSQTAPTGPNSSPNDRLTRGTRSEGRRPSQEPVSTKLASTRAARRRWLLARQRKYLCPIPYRQRTEGLEKLEGAYQSLGNEGFKWIARFDGRTPMLEDLMEPGEFERASSDVRLARVVWSTSLVKRYKKM